METSVVGSLCSNHEELPIVVCGITGQRRLAERVHQDVTPRRVLSPLKKFNRVAPISNKASVAPERGAFKLEEDTPLKSSSASLLEQAAKDPASSGEKGRPDSAPHKRDEQIGQGVPIDARVIVKSNGEEVDTQEVNGMELKSVVGDE
jgi:hypothetical protein